MPSLHPSPSIATDTATLSYAPSASTLTASGWLLRVLAACALAAALGGCDRAPSVPTFDPPPPGAPVPKSGASQPGGAG